MYRRTPALIAFVAVLLSLAFVRFLSAGQAGASVTLAETVPVAADDSALARGRADVEVLTVSDLALSWLSATRATRSVLVVVAAPTEHVVPRLPAGPAEEAAFCAGALEADDESDSFERFGSEFTTLVSAQDATRRGQGAAELPPSRRPHLLAARAPRDRSLADEGLPRGPPEG